MCRNYFYWTTKFVQFALQYGVKLQFNLCFFLNLVFRLQVTMNDEHQNVVSDDAFTFNGDQVL